MPLRRAFGLVALVAATAALSVGPWATTPSHGSAGSLQMPTDPEEAMAFFESDVAKWADGPVGYLFLREEQEEWEDLETDEERREFIEWFWARRDNDSRDRVNPFQVGFYTRVADANRRFPGSPRGWRSDRGRVWIVFGRPDNMKTDLATELDIWTYRTYGGILRVSSHLGEMQVAFIRTRLNRREIYGGMGAGAWPHYLLSAFEIVNRAVVENPTLKRGQ